QTEVELLCQAQLSTEDLQTAKNKLLGQYALGKQTNGQIAQVYGWYEILGLGIEFDRSFQQEIAQVSAETTQQAACRYLLEPYISMVGPETAIGDR
ncbi:MAG: insulinase family protein, partial [Chroococcidiopsis sp.]